MHFEWDNARKRINRRKHGLRFETAKPMETLTDKQTRALRQLAGLPDSEIDTGDAPERTDFAAGVRGRFHQPSPQPVTPRIDADILDWFAARGEPEQTHITAALRDYLAHQRGR